MALYFQASKENETLSVEEVPAKALSGDPHELAVDVEVTKIASENLTTSEGLPATETVSGVTADDVEREKRAEV
jgi:hypothetical protein